MKNTYKIDWAVDAFPDFSPSSVSNQNHDQDQVQLQSNPFISSSDSINNLPPLCTFHPILLESNLSDNSPIVSITCYDNNLYVAFEHHILKYYNNQYVETIQLKNKKDESSIYRIFLDPLLSFLLISLISGHNYLVTLPSNKPILLSKMKNFVVESVFWLHDEETHSILCGSIIGYIGYLIFDQRCKEKSFRKIHISSYNNEPNPDQQKKICGLWLEEFPVGLTSGVSNDGNSLEHKYIALKHKYVILCCTASRLFQFVGGPSIDQILDNIPNHKKFCEYPTHSKSQNSQLDTIGPALEARASHCAWLTSAGIYYGTLVYGSQQSGDSVINQDKLIFYIEFDNHEPSYYENPLALSLSPFHFFLCYPHSFIAINNISQKIDYHERFNDSFIGMCKDRYKNNLYLYTDSIIIQVQIHIEDRNACQLYLSQGNYSSALKHANNDQMRYLVLKKEAQSQFEKGSYDLAASLLAKIPGDFHQHVLKLVEVNHLEALLTYLLKKLDYSASTDLLSRTLLSTWALEIYLSLLSAAEDSKQKELQEIIEMFLSNYYSSLNPTTAYELFTNFGQISLLIHYADLLKDINVLVDHYFQEQEYLKAIEVMIEYSKSSSIHLDDILFKYLSTLMHHVPIPTVDFLISLAHVSTIDPLKLLPFMLEDNNELLREETIRYLYSFVSYHHLSQTSHKILNSLCHLLSLSNDEERLYKFILTYSSNIDLTTCLSHCYQNHCLKSCVLIYSLLHQYIESVTLAVNIDFELAKEIVNECTDEKIKKSLWIIIARHLIEKNNNIHKAIALLKDNDYIKIEDILPFFPDFVLIGDFKDEICASLECYNQQIQQLTQQMDECTLASNNIRQDIHNLQYRNIIIKADQNCFLCNLPLLSNEFYVFPCHHVFHATCFQNHIKSNPLKDSLHNISCILCGEYLIQELIEPFTRPTEYDEISKWRI